MIWTSALIVELRELWAEGHSTAAIGRRLGVSKNAIVGKAHRLELDSRPSPIAGRVTAGLPPAPRMRKASTLPPLPSDAARPPAPLPPPKPREVPMLPPPPCVEGQNVMVLPAMPRRTCEYLAGNIKPYVRCTQPSVAGKSWCLEHFRLCVTKIPGWAAA